ncbi:MAG: hypothetical protein M1840_006551 [Geoglossum simile]|nr:MAG: hypothetical protein M1840_006551 [Geoglossum simile]
MSYQTPDLASILRTLASLAPKQPQPIAQPLPATFEVPEAPLSLQSKAYELEEGEYEPPDSVCEIRDSQQSTLDNVPERTTAAQERSSRDPRLHPASTPVSTRPAEVIAPIDTTTITDWPAGLRYVMKAVAQSDAIMAKIKEMIADQHKHERMWWEGRQAILKKQEARIEGKKKLDEVLRSVGGIVPAGNSVSTPEQDAQELQAYDRKVYKASVDMTRKMVGDLGKLGIPFFCTNLARGNGAGSTLGGPLGGSESGRVGEQELVGLQRKMLVLLEDLCK